MAGRNIEIEMPYLKKIDMVFFNEGEIRDAVYEARQLMIKPELKNSSGLSDPTAYEAIKNVDPVKFVQIKDTILEKPEKWLEVIDKTYKWCRRQGEIYNAVTWRKYSGERFSSICADLAIEKTCFYRIIERVRVYALIQAVQLNLLYVR